MTGTPVDLGNIETGNDYYFVVSWDPNPDNDINTPEGELTVYFGNPIIDDINKGYQERFLHPPTMVMAYWGFTSSTGGANNTQVVSNITPTFLVRELLLFITFN